MTPKVTLVVFLSPEKAKLGLHKKLLLASFSVFHRSKIRGAQKVTLLSSFLQGSKIWKIRVTQKVTFVLFSPGEAMI